MINLIGYWRPLGSRDSWDPSEAELPDPRQLVDPLWDPDQKRQILRYLRQGKVAEAYRGYSCCRFSCGIPDWEMGSVEVTDGVWAWPEGLSHYVAIHSVRLPSDFIAHAEQHRFEILRPVVRNFHSVDGPTYDLSFWTKWAASQASSRMPRNA